MKKYLLYILILTIASQGIFGILRIEMANARDLDKYEKQNIASAQHVLEIIQKEYAELSSKQVLTKGEQNRLTELKLRRDAAIAEINLINKNAGQGLTPLEKEQLYTAQNIGAGISKPVALPGTPTPNATPPKTSTNTSYQLLAPLPGLGDADNKVNTATGLESYLNTMIKLFIGICAVLSVVMIVTGGLEYMTSELSHTKEAGKERITHAILGLLIALGAYALLYTINPDLLKSDVEILITTTPPTTNPLVAPTVRPGAIGTGTCSYPQYTWEGACLSGGGKWTSNPR